MINNKSKITILGGKGMLGTDLAEACQRDGLDVEVLDLPQFDITNQQQLQESLEDTQTIINCAAYTDVDGAESHKDLAFEVNAEAPGRLAELAKKSGAWLLHISTDFVFDGRLNRAYIETDAANPISTYGKSKLAGEQLITQSGCRSCIIRVEWTYGHAGNNFVKKLIQRAKTDGTIKVVDDQVGSPTATTEVAKAICKLLTVKPVGLFHFASSGYASRYEMAQFIFDKLSIDVNLLACKTKDFASPADRPLNSRFDCSRIQKLLDEPIENWQVPLESFLRCL